jgi:hypothetical protein
VASGGHATADITFITYRCARFALVGTGYIVYFLLSILRSRIAYGCLIGVNMSEIIAYTRRLVILELDKAFRLNSDKPYLHQHFTLKQRAQL